jgi:hypothetical protein
MMSVLWIVCPVFQDSAAFLELRRGVVRHLAPWHLGPRREVRFVVIDDTGHQDPEMTHLDDVDDVRILHAPFNLGHQGALVFGLRALTPQIAAEDWVVTMDADGEDQPADLPRLLGVLCKQPPGSLDVVLAHRTKRHESWAFKGLYAAFKLLFRSLTGLVVRTGNYAAFSGAFVRDLLSHPSFDLSYSSTLVSLNVPTILVPCERGRRAIGQSRMGLSALVRHGLGMLMPFTDRIATRALLAFAVLFAMSMLIAGTVALVAALTSHPIPVWTWYLLASILVVSLTSLGHSVLLFMLFAQSRGLALRGLGPPGGVRDWRGEEADVAVSQP